MAHKAKKFTAWPFYKKKFSPALKKQSGLKKYLINYSTPLENKRLIKEIDMTAIVNFIPMLLFRCDTRQALVI